MSLGKKLKKYRIEKGLTQTELAEQAAIYQKNISDYEADVVTPSVTMMKKLADVLDVSIDHLVSDSPNIIGDKRLIRMCKELDKMEPEDKMVVLKMVEAYIRDYKLKKTK